MSYMRPQKSERFNQLSFEFNQAAMDNAKANDAKAHKEKTAMATTNTNTKTTANGKANGNGKPKAKNGAARKNTPNAKVTKAKAQEFGDGSWKAKNASVAQTGKIYRLIGLDVRPLNLTRGAASDMVQACIDNPKAARAKIIKRKGVLNKKPLPTPVSDEEKARRQIKSLQRRLKKLAS